MGYIFSFVFAFACLVAVQSDRNRGSSIANIVYPRTAECILPKGVGIRSCDRMLQRVCGSNGKTYSNECMLCLAIEDTGQDIQVIKEGQC